MRRRKSSWKTRIHGTRQQIGQKFQLRTKSTRGMASRLPRITGHVKGHLDVTQPERVVRLSLIKVNTNELIPRESHPVDIERRAQYFVDAYKRGLTIPPILVHRLPNGKLEILDGHARVEAYRRLGITQIPAIENGILESLGKGAKAVGRAITSGARMASQYGQKAVKYGERVGKYAYRKGMEVGKAAEEVSAQVGRISRAYEGEVAPREQLEHEEKIARIRAKREQEPRIREIVREQNIPFGGTSSPLLSQPMQQEVRRAKWSRESRRERLKALRKRTSRTQRMQDLTRKAKKTVKELPQKTKKGFRGISGS